MKKIRKYLILLLLSIAITILTGIFRIPGIYSFEMCLDSAGFPLGYYSYQISLPPYTFYCKVLTDPMANIFAFVIDVLFWYLILYLIRLFLPKLKELISSSKFFS